MFDQIVIGEIKIHSLGKENGFRGARDETDSGHVRLDASTITNFTTRAGEKYPSVDVRVGWRGRESVRGGEGGRERVRAGKRGG